MTKLIKPRILKGFRDFLPQEALTRQRLMRKIADLLEKYGYEPLETPALEYADTLLGKYGTDADKLLYLFKDRGGRQVGLRYDQTVPLARVISQYPQLPLPFKRYQIQPVWRAENTQKGRYREFLQCDFDIIGCQNKSMADAEILVIISELYTKLGFEKFQIIVNSRVVLRSLIAKVIKKEPPLTTFLSFVRSIDKLEKIGQLAVDAELQKKGLSPEEVKELFKQLAIWKCYSLNELAAVDSQFAETLKIANQYYNLPTEKIRFNPALARGLDYYTGIIIEVVLPEDSGSIGGGGRYDNLITQFTGQDVPAVGFAIGFDRTIEKLKEQGLIQFPATVSEIIILLCNDNPKVLPTALEIAQKLRAKGKRTEIYLDYEKNLHKQLKYADKKGINTAIIIGNEEISNQLFTCKNLRERTQRKCTLTEVINSV